MSLSRLFRRLSASKSRDEGYRLVFPGRIDRRRLVRDVAALLGVSPARVRELHHRYRSFHEAQRYEGRFGERKTLNLDEAFVVCTILDALRPQGPVVEIGTQYGRSTRRILDMLRWLQLTNEVICFDIDDQVDNFTPDEARLRIEDVTGRFSSVVLDALSPGLVFLDAHPYHLIKEVITDVLERTDDCVLVVHDCGKALCNPNMTLRKDDLNVTSSSGHWERHVLCEVFGVSDPMTGEIDRQETRTHVLTIMQTTHGLGVIVPRRMVGHAPNASLLLNPAWRTT